MAENVAVVQGSPHCSLEYNPQKLFGGSFCVPHWISRTYWGLDSSNPLWFNRHTSVVTYYAEQQDFSHFIFNAAYFWTYLECYEKGFCLWVGLLWEQAVSLLFLVITWCMENHEPACPLSMPTCTFWGPSHPLLLVVAVVVLCGPDGLFLACVINGIKPKQIEAITLLSCCRIQPVINKWRTFSPPPQQ